MNMNKDLAKQLKEAGFPQNTHGSGLWFDDTGGVSPHIWLSSSKGMDTSKCYYGPSFGEIVDNLGEVTLSIHPEHTIATAKDAHGKLATARADTPIVASALLYIMLSANRKTLDKGSSKE